MRARAKLALQLAGRRQTSSSFKSSNQADSAALHVKPEAMSSSSHAKRSSGTKTSTQTTSIFSGTRFVHADKPTTPQTGEAGTFIGLEELLRLLHERGLDPDLPIVAQAIAEYADADGQGVHVPTADPDNILTKVCLAPSRLDAAAGHAH